MPYLEQDFNPPSGLLETIGAILIKGVENDSVAMVLLGFYVITLVFAICICLYLLKLLKEAKESLEACHSEREDLKVEVNTAIMEAQNAREEVRRQSTVLVSHAKLINQLINKK
jgi:hypothetical protein